MSAQVSYRDYTSRWCWEPCGRDCDGFAPTGWIGSIGIQDESAAGLSGTRVSRPDGRPPCPQPARNKVNCGAL